MRRLLSYLFLIAALPLLFSCGKAPEEAAPVNYHESYVWQRNRWDSCFQEVQKYLDPYVRQDEMRTLDAAYVALLSAEETSEESYTVPFDTYGVPCEARVQRSQGYAKVNVFRNGVEVGVFTMDDTVFTIESTGIKIEANPLSVSSTEVHAAIVLSADGTTLATLDANGPMELVDVAIDLPEGISLRGNVEVSRLWDAVRAIADEDAEEKVTPLVEEADAAIHVNVFYEGDLSTPHARVSMIPLHIFSRYDDYWTWRLIIRTDDGGILNDAWNGIGSLDDTTASFVQAWQHLLANILS